MLPHAQRVCCGGGRAYRLQRFAILAYHLHDSIDTWRIKFKYHTSRTTFPEFYKGECKFGAHRYHCLRFEMQQYI